MVAAVVVAAVVAAAVALQPHRWRVGACGSSRVHGLCRCVQMRRNLGCGSAESTCGVNGGGGVMDRRWQGEGPAPRQSIAGVPRKCVCASYHANKSPATMANGMMRALSNQSLRLLFRRGGVCRGGRHHQHTAATASTVTSTEPEVISTIADFRRARRYSNEREA